MKLNEILETWCVVANAFPALLFSLLATSKAIWNYLLLAHSRSITSASEGPEKSGGQQLASGAYAHGWIGTILHKERPRMAPQVRMKNRVPFSRPLRTHSCSHIRRIPVNTSEHPLTLLGGIR